jgi:outer membrane protein assembly factor BamA
MDAAKPLRSGRLVSFLLKHRHSQVVDRGEIARLLHRLELLLILFITIAPGQARAPRIAAIDVTGNRAIPAYRILENLSLREGEPFSAPELRAAVDAITAFYHDEGFLAATVRADSSITEGAIPGIDVRIRIDEGARCRVGTIGFSGNVLFTSERLREIMDTRTGSILRQADLLRDLDAIVALYEETGYPFASASLSRVSWNGGDDPTGALLEFAIDEGSFVIVNEIDVRGAKQTRTDVIVRESGIRTGEPYNQTRVTSVPARLSRLNIFSRIGEPELYLTDRGGGIAIVVEEGNANTFDGVIGYVPSATGGDPGYVTGLVNVTMRNLFGTARRIQVRWQREDRHSQELGLRYLEPWLFDVPLDLSGGFVQRQQDSTYVRRDYDLLGSLRVSDDVRISGNLQAQSVIPAATLPGSGLPPSSTLMAGLEVSVDTRDDAVTPAHGVFFRNGLALGRKSVDGVATTGEGGSALVRRFILDVDYYVSPFRRQIVAMSVHGREIRADNLDIADLYRLGGSTTLRGFRENQFQGSRLAWASTEYRFLLSRRSYFFGFVDGGYYFRPEGVDAGSGSKEEFRTGYGFGIRLETGLGLLGVSFALGNGDTIGEGKIHVGIINEF